MAKNNAKSVRNYPFLTLYILIKFDKLYMGNCMKRSKTL